MVDLTKELKLSRQLYEQLVFERNKVKRLESDNQKAEKQATEIEGGCCNKKLFHLQQIYFQPNTRN